MGLATSEPHAHFLGQKQDSPTELLPIHAYDRALMGEPYLHMGLSVSGLRVLEGVVRPKELHELLC